MKQIHLLLCVFLVGFAHSSLLGQQKNTSSTATQNPAPTSANTQTLKPALAFGLQDGTPVKLRITRNLSSADAKVGETVDFEVLEDVKIGETVIIQRGSIAWATVTEAQPKRRMGRGGKLNVNIDSVRLASGEKAALRAVKDAEGGGNTGKMTGAIVATSIIFFPAAPLFLFVKGKDITIPKGTEITAYTNGDFELNPAKFMAGGAEKAPSNGNVPTSTNADADTVGVIIKSTPDGAEITIDEKFVGNTPSTLRLKPGDHVISISKSGFILWKRTVTLSLGSSITVDATLEKKQ
ncbi:MAG: PEGA domain-containing protein [Acidobacteria bacterium]|nr:PEGA domain-containing protein [Acidobacteriota bacterium]